MTRNLTALMLSAGLAACAASPLIAQSSPVPEVTLTRLACGADEPPGDVSFFSDTYEFQTAKIPLTFSCYLIKHGNEYLIWDTGYAMDTAATAPKQSLVELLAQLRLTPAQVKYVAISHIHSDHTGQARLFPQSTLLMGKPDWDVLADPKRPTPPVAFANWINGGGKVDPVTGDRDIFGDGTVIMLNTPGHTAGHHALLVKLKDMGNVLLTGDLSHFRENYDRDGVPQFNSNRAATLASLDRFKAIARQLNATVIIQHDMGDVKKLPAFPAAAK